MTDYLICYDISEPKRLGRVHRQLKRWALPIQYSVFLFCGDKRALDRHLKKLRELINEKKDDLRCYPLPKRGLRQRMGRPTLPEGIIYTDLPSDPKPCYSALGNTIQAEDGAEEYVPRQCSTDK